MNLQPEQLSEHGYELMEELNHQEIIPFVRTYIKKRTPSAVLYMLGNILGGAALAVCYIMYCIEGPISLDTALTQTSMGIGIAFLLIPLHEYIHALAYKSQGALFTSYDANLKKLYFMAMADHFVANQKEFRVVALAPVASISALLLLLIPFAKPEWIFTIVGTLITHMAFCSGDFALLSYFEFHSDKDIVTYDDKAKGMSYFLGKSK
jgi:hypothetical protein